MEKKEKCQNKFIKNTICSLHEVEDFLCSFNKFSDILKVIKVAKKQQKKHH